MRETSTPIDILDDLNAGSDEVAKWILPLIFPDLNARTLQDKGNQHLLQDNVARLAGNLQTVASNVTAYSEALQMQWQAIAALAKGHGQTTNDMRELRALIESVVDGVTDVAQELAAARSAMQDSTKVTSATTETIQQGQRTLQTEVEKITDAARQTIAALTATAAEQTAVHETVRRVREEVTGVAARQTALSETVQAHEQAGAAATATLAGRHDQLAGDVRRLHELTQTVVGSIGDVVREQAALRGAMQESARVTSATAETIQQGQRALQAEVEKTTDTAKQTIAALTATVAEQTAVHETIRRVSEEVTGVAAKQTALGEAVQAHEQASAAATATLAGRQDQLAGDVRRLHELTQTVVGGHEQLTGDVRRLHELTQTVVGGVADVAREQAAVRGAIQDNARVMSATAETIQQGQRTLQAEVEKITDAAKQTSAALTATAAEQTAVHETVRRVSEEVTGVAARQTALSEAVQAHEQTSAAATATLAGGQGQLAGDVRRLHELTQTVVGGVVDVAREQAAARGAMQDSTKVVSATTEAIQQGQRALQTEVEKIADTTRQTIAALTATAAEQTAAHETVRRVREEVTGVGARQAALNEAVQAHGQAITGAAATLAGGQEQLAGDVRRLHELTQMVVGGVADVAREQAGVRGATQDNAKVMSATIETIQQGLRALQTEIEKMVETTRQTLAALATTAAEQTTGQEITRRMIGEVANAAMAALAAGHGRLTGEVPQFQASTQTVDDPRSLEVGPPVPTEEEDHSQRLHAAKAITHGEQIRYEVGPDRDNLGFWTKASDWAQWELDVTRPGRFKVTAEIAALASGRFQVVFGDQKLEGSAPNTGDYARFQQVELGTVELASSGKTSVAVRPIAEGWQPMNLKSLDLVPLP